MQNRGQNRTKNAGLLKSERPANGLSSSSSVIHREVDYDDGSNYVGQVIPEGYFDEVAIFSEG